MANTLRHQWNPDFTALSPLFKPLFPIVSAFLKHQSNDWPDIDAYQSLLIRHTDNIHSLGGAPLHFVSQGQVACCFEEHYEPRIYLKGEIQTRSENWHDFFQVLVWSLFPKIKIQLNSLHYQAALARQLSTPQKNNRSPIENAIALFDECGVIITSSDPDLLHLIREFQWQELFCQRRNELEQNLQCIVFGHALYEKALQPYVGMTGNALLIDVDIPFQTLSPLQQAAQLDDQISHYLHRLDTDFRPPLLTPFPLLGMPGWDTDNHTERYYDNKSYFRDKRPTRGQCLTKR